MCCIFIYTSDVSWSANFVLGTGFLFLTISTTMIRCPKKECNIPMELAQNAPREVQCLTCNHQFCATCKAAPHPGAPCLTDGKFERRKPRCYTLSRLCVIESIIIIMLSVSYFVFQHKRNKFGMNGRQLTKQDVSFSENEWVQTTSNLLWKMRSLKNGSRKMPSLAPRAAHLSK